MPKRLRSIAEWLAGLGIVAGVAWLVLSAWQPVRVSGGSMHPALHPGDLAIVRKRAPVRAGDVALLVEPGHGPVLHRIESVGDDATLRTRGDANSVADRDPVPASAVGGRLVAVVPVGLLVERWRGGREVRYDVAPTEQSEATTEKTSAHTPTDQGRAP